MNVLLLLINLEDGTGSCTETSVITSQRCATCHSSENLIYTAGKVWSKTLNFLKI